MKLQYASNFFLNLHKRRDFQNMLKPVAEDLAILGNVNTVDTEQARKDYNIFLNYVSNHWKTVYLVPGSYEYCSKIPKPFYELYSNLTELKHKYPNIYILNNSNKLIPNTDIQIIGSTLWTKNPYYRLPCCFEYSYMHKHTKDNTIRPFLGNDFKEWFEEDLTHIKNSLKPNSKNIILTHHLPLFCLTKQTIQIRMEASNLESLFTKKIPVWLSGAGNRTISGVFGLTNDTFCGVNSYTTFNNPDKINDGYSSKMFVSLRSDSSTELV